MIAAVFFLILIIVIWGSLLIPLTPIIAVAYVADKVEKRELKEGWFGSIFYATDIMSNVILSGYKRTTISAEFGNLRLEGSKGGTIAADFIDKIWYFVFKEGNHCTVAMEKEDKFHFSPFKGLLGAFIYLLTYYFIGF